MKITFGDIVDGAFGSGLFKLMSAIRVYRDKLALLPIYDAVRVGFVERSKIINERMIFYKDYVETQGNERVVNLNRMPPDLRSMFEKEQVDNNAFVLYESEIKPEIEIPISVLNCIDFDGNELWYLSRFLTIKEREDNEIDKLRDQLTEMKKSLSSNRRA